MTIDLAPDQLDTLRAYAAGQRGTRDTIDRLDLADYAELVIALAQHDLDLPKPPESATRDARLERARVILQPRLAHGR